MDLQGHTAFKDVTGRQLDMSSGRGWTNVLAERWDHEAGALPSLLPRETEVAVLLSARSLVYREGAGLRQRTPGRPGTVWLCPAGIREERIDFEQPLHDCLHIFLPPDPFAKCMLQDLDIDPARAGLRYEASSERRSIRSVHRHRPDSRPPVMMTFLNPARRLPDHSWVRSGMLEGATE